MSTTRTYTTPEACSCCGGEGCTYDIGPYANEAAAQAFLDESTTDCLAVTEMPVFGPYTSTSTVDLSGGDINIHTDGSLDDTDIYFTHSFRAAFKGGTVHIEVTLFQSALGNTTVTIQASKTGFSQLQGFSGVPPFGFGPGEIGNHGLTAIVDFTLPDDDLYVIEVIAHGINDYDDGNSGYLDTTVHQEETTISPCVIRAEYGTPVEYLNCELP